MPSTQFASNTTSSVSQMESYTNINTYTVYECTDDGLMLPSTFLSKKDAYKFVKDYTDSTSNVYVFKTKCVRVYNSSNDSQSAEHEVAETLSSMKYHKTSASQQATLVDPDYNSDEDPDYVPNDDYISEDDHMSDDHEDDDVSLEGMFIRKYGKGYLLIPPSNSEFFGQKYFLDGWWMPSQKGWFFKTEFVDNLTNLGAMYVTKSRKNIGKSHGNANTNSNPFSPKTRSGKTRAKSASVAASDAASSQWDLSKMALSTYGRGYLLTAHSSHPQYAKYYYYDTHGFTDSQQEDGTFTHAGFWNSKAKGWFFKKSCFTYLTSVAGAKFIKSESSSASSSASASKFIMSDDLSTMTLTNYGKGYLLTPSTNDSRSGTKYFDLPDGGQGWWRNDLSGWFFRPMYYDELVDMGAQYVSQNNVIEDSYEVVSTDEQFEYIPNFTKYGKGWILHPDDKFVYDDSKKYFEGAWWMPAANGWFFRTNAKKLFMNKYGYA